MKDIERRRNSFSTSDPEWFLYNSELRFAKAYKDNPSSLDTKLWQFIYQENMRLIQEKDKEDFKEPKWEIMPLRIMKGLDEITSTILYNRGVTKDVEEFLDCSLEKIKPENKGDIEKACRLILKAINQDIPITIYGDYDADGITGTVLAIKALERLGARVDYFINSRGSGYAVNESGMRQIASRGIPRLIITVDNGITSYEAIEFAKKANMVVIITDHHEFNKKPNAHAVIHSKDFDEPLAGVGVMLVSCGYCKAHIAKYQKLGKGNLLRMHIDRIIESSIDLSKDPKVLTCPDCNAQLGVRMVLKGRDKEVFNMLRSTYNTKRID